MMMVRACSLLDIFSTEVVINVHVIVSWRWVAVFVEKSWLDGYDCVEWERKHTVVSWRRIEHKGIGVPLLSLSTRDFEIRHVTRRM